MSTAQGSVRQRGSTPSKKGSAKGDAKTNGNDEAFLSTPSAKPGGNWGYKLSLGIITALAFITRFYGINHPDEVVFDEVHFGKFASYYLQRMYFFDVHPPFGKLLFAFTGWLVGYDGHFLFDNIGDSYIENKVPYVAFRALPALMGSLTVSVTFLIMWESGYSVPAAVVAASLVLFDNAHIGQTRLILLDATLVFAMSLSVLCYIRFYKMRHEPFGRKWWKWLLLTGVSLSCVISTKYVGVFTFLTIGSAVAIDLWGLLDVNRKYGALSLPEFGKHLSARIIGLIVVPFFFYLFWFQIHFAILTRSGPGDDFMTPEFQESLSDNIMTASSVGIEYYDNIVIRHKHTKAYLHSHQANYPLRYEDGRISSQGQQVTGYPHNDTNNIWQILPAEEYVPENAKAGRAVIIGDNVRLLHVGTNSLLLSHDVASPYHPTNQEFTTINPAEADQNRFNDTLFELRVEGGKDGNQFRSMAGHFKLVHFPSKVAMWTHTTALPDWGFNQQEINGNKVLTQSSNIWYVEEISSLSADHERMQNEPRKVRQIPFLKKYFELQRAMFFHNNALTSSHPYASFPHQWPFLLRGVSFWTQNDSRRQIYFLGNPLGWWIASCVLAVFAGILGADQLSLRRGIDALDERTRSRLYNSTGFFFLCWSAHYFPFYLMGRQLFLHHYLPAHLASALVTGALVEFIFGLDSAPSTPAQHKKGSQLSNRRSLGSPERFSQQGLLAIWGATGVLLSIVIGSWFYFLPLTYGKPGLSVEQVLARKWLNYDLHFAK